MFTNFFNGIRAAAGSSFESTNEDPNDAVAQWPSGTGLPPNPCSMDSRDSRDSRDSPPTSETSRVVIDLSSPTKRSSRPSHKESQLRTSCPRLQKFEKSEDEKRLVGDYTRPADAVEIPDPKSYMPLTKRTITAKPGSNSGFRPLDTMNTGPNAPSRKPTTYGKKDRPPPSLIGQARGPGQIAYLQHREHRVPSTPSRRLSSRDGHDSRSGGATSGKRQKIDHVITLDDDDDDEVSKVSHPAYTTHVGTLQDQRHAVGSEQSRISIGSGSTIGDFRPLQSKSEFRQVDSFLKSSQKKPRKSNSDTPKGDLRHSPFGGGALSNSPGAHANRQAILQDFQQGEAKQSPTRHDSFESKLGSVTSRFFPNARINESTSEPMEKQPANVESAHLRTQHRSAPSRTQVISDSYSADELAITPPQPGSKSPSRSKQKQAANSGVKRNAGGKFIEEAWPLVFARSSDFEGNGSMSEDGHATLVLKCNEEGLRVQIWEPVDGCYETTIIILRKEINKVLADGTSRIRLQGPRRGDGNLDIFDLEFASTPDCFLFLNDHASSMTLNGTYLAKSDDHMDQLFRRPLPPRNEKIGTSALVNDTTVQSKQLDQKSNGTSNKRFLDQLKRAGDGTAASATFDATATSMEPTPPSRARRLAPIHYVEDVLTRSGVPRYSVDTGLGQPWTRCLQYGEGRQRAIVHFDDLTRLDEEEYMNDSLIDFYMIYLFKQLKVPADKVYFFNTYFFTKLTENSGRKSIDYKAVERWTSKINIFSYDYIVVPINENQSHWYLAIICNVSKIDRKSILRDFDAPQANVRQQSNASTTTTKHEATAIQTPTLSLDPPAVIPETQVEPSDEEPNLFDEAVISLVDRDDIGIEASHASEATKVGSARQDPEAGSLTGPPVSIDARDTHQGILSHPQLAAPSTKTKAKRKSIPKRDPDQPVVIVLDSLAGNSRLGAVRALKDWIIAEGEHKLNMKTVIKENGYYTKDTQIPMQGNWTDCGVYLLGYIEKFFQNPDEFKNKLLTGSMSALEDWPELKPSEMRHKMRQIIFDCYKKQEEDRKAQKKVKKGSAGSKTSPAPTTHESGDQSRCNTEESRKAEAKLEQSPRNGNAQPTSPEAHSPARLPPRLGSPFSIDMQRAASIRESPPVTISKVSDSSPISTSPMEQAIVAPRSEEIPKLHSEVRIPSIAPRSHGSIRNGPSTSDGSPHLVKALHQTGHLVGTLSAKKRRRQAGDGSQVESRSAKRQLTRSPRRVHDGSVMREQLASHSREGSAHNAPIEIDDFQKVKVVSDSHRQRVQASQISQRKPSSRPSRPKQAIRPSPSLEEISGSSFSVEKSKHGRREGSPVDSALKTWIDEDDYPREKAQRSKAPAPSEANGLWERRDKEVFDSIEGISQSTNQLQLDGINNGSVVRETPEPDGRSPVAQNGTSRQDPLLL